MQNIQSLLQGLVSLFSKQQEISPQPPQQMPPGQESTIIENVQQLIEPNAVITEIVSTNAPEYHLSHMEELPKCLTDQAMERASSSLHSPTKKRLKINDDNSSQINQTETIKILLDTIGKCIILLF